MVLVTIVLAWRVRPRAAWLMAPYFAWVLFATLLNWQILQLNPDADGQSDSNTVVHVKLNGG